MREAQVSEDPLDDERVVLWVARPRRGAHAHRWIRQVRTPGVTMSPLSSRWRGVVRSALRYRHPDPVIPVCWLPDEIALAIERAIAQ